MGLFSRFSKKSTDETAEVDETEVDETEVDETESMRPNSPTAASAMTPPTTAMTR